VGVLLTPINLIFLLVCCVVLVVPYWQIFKKAGMPAPISLLMLVPLVNVILLYVLAFSDWKVTPVPYPPQQLPGDRQL
jgi:hypothetical protein